MLLEGTTPLSLFLLLFWTWLSSLLLPMVRSESPYQRDSSDDVINSKLADNLKECNASDTREKCKNITSAYLPWSELERRSDGVVGQNPTETDYDKPAEREIAFADIVEPTLKPLTPTIAEGSEKYPGYDKGYAVRQLDILWKIWKGHGLVGTVVALFLLPMSAFISRYYKESFMTSRWFYARIWYQVHTQMSAWIFVLLIAGLMVVEVGVKALGRGLTFASLVHRISGLVAYTALSVVMVGSGFRTVNQRKVLIFIHWFTGWIVYIACLVCVFTSVWIPGSPSVIGNHTIPNEVWRLTNANKWMEPVVILTSAWILVEAISHLIMICLMNKSDQKMEVIHSRQFCPPPMPVISEEMTLDAQGSILRTCMLFIVGTTSVTISLIICWLIYFSEGDDRAYGPMTCTHDVESLRSTIMDSKFPTSCTD